MPVLANTSDTLFVELSLLGIEESDLADDPIGFVAEVAFRILDAGAMPHDVLRSSVSLSAGDTAALAAELESFADDDRGALRVALEDGEIEIGLSRAGQVITAEAVLDFAAVSEALRDVGFGRNRCSVRFATDADRVRSFAGLLRHEVARLLGEG